MVKWLNDAQLASDSEKVELLKKVTEITVHKEPELLGEFLEHTIAFHADRNAEVRKAVLTFIELVGLVYVCQIFVFLYYFY